MKANEFITEAKAVRQRLDPKCWTGKKIGNPKTKVKGGVRVNNCVPAESAELSEEFDLIENIVEKELGISGKRDIETKIGVEKFNDTCRSKVLTYTAEWKKMVDRIGRFVDFDNSYKTMDPTYMESVWWALKTLWDKGLIYEGKKVLTGVEIDKISDSIEGIEVVNQLIHILDNTQNNIFYDKYIADIPIDLSNIWFICSLNNIDAINFIFGFFKLG